MTPGSADEQLSALAGFVADLRDGRPVEVKLNEAWEKAAGQIVMLNTPDHLIATVWHPEAVGEVVVTGHGNVRVLVGPAQYQLSTGEIVAL